MGQEVTARSMWISPPPMMFPRNETKRTWDTLFMQIQTSNNVGSFEELKGGRTYRQGVLSGSFWFAVAQSLTTVNAQIWWFYLNPCSWCRVVGNYLSFPQKRNWHQQKRTDEWYQLGCHLWPLSLRGGQGVQMVLGMIWSCLVGQWHSLNVLGSTQLEPLTKVKLDLDRRVVVCCDDRKDYTPGYVTKSMLGLWHLSQWKSRMCGS